MKRLITLTILFVGIVFFGGCTTPPVDQTATPQAEVTHTTMSQESTGSVTEDVAAFESEINSLDASDDFPDFNPAEFQE